MKELFEQWWIGQDTGLGDAHKLTAWNAWLAAAAVEREACLSLCDGSAYDEVRDIAEKIREHSNA